MSPELTFGYGNQRYGTSKYGRGADAYFGYDALNRISKLQDAVGGTAYFGYDIGGNTSQTLDALNRATYFAYDKLDRLTTVLDAMPNPVYFGYDTAGNRNAEMDARQHTTYYQYDALDRLVAVLDPLLKTAYYGYDANSNLAQTLDNNAVATYFGYDALDRRTAIKYPAENQYFAYDAGGNLAQTLDAWGASYFGYDALNRVTARSTPRADAVYYGYDAASNLARLQYPQGTACYYGYDGAQRMNSLLSPYAKSAYWTYDSQNNVLQKTYGNGMVSFANFDNASRISSLRYATSAGAAIAYFDYSRDAAGRITAIGRETDLAVYYSYDKVDRILAETWRKKSNNAQIYAFSYNYDATGNRLTQRREAAGPADYESTYYSYANDNSRTKKQIQNSGLSTYYYYDANGSLTTSVEGANATYFTYAPSGMIASITPPVADGNAWNFNYDSRLNRYKIDKGGGTISYLLWDGLNMMEERDGAGALVGRYTYGYSPIAGIGNCVEIYLQSTATTYAIAMDHRGTGHVLLDGTGAEVGRRYYDAFGVILGQTGTWPVALGYQSNWQTVQIGSKWWGLSAARVYDFATGQFTQRDVLPNLLRVVSAAPGNAIGIFDKNYIRLGRRNISGMSLYCYARGTPSMRVDPIGTMDYKVTRTVPPPKDCPDCPCTGKDNDCLIDVTFLNKGDTWSISYLAPGAVSATLKSTDKDLSDPNWTPDSVIDEALELPNIRFKYHQKTTVLVMIKSKSGKDVRKCHLAQDVVDRWGDIEDRGPKKNDYGSKNEASVFYGGWWLIDAVEVNLISDEVYAKYFWQAMDYVEENPDIKAYWGWSTDVAWMAKVITTGRKTWGPENSATTNPFKKK